MVEPALRSDGNLRLAGVTRPGYPSDADAVAARVRGAVETQTGCATYGPTTILFTLPPHDEPATWENTVGVACTGLPVPVEDVQVEDYRDLKALTIAHSGPIRDLADTHRRLVERARTQGYVLRPYWRVQLWRKRLSDGAVLPQTDVAVFVDRY